MPSFEIGPAPSWVKPVQAPVDVEPGTENRGTAYLLVDRQEKVDLNAFYYHDVRKITSEAGVQRGVSISVSFNPAFEKKLIFHSIRVLRNGAVLNRLDRSQIRITQRDADPDHLVYGTSYSAEMMLADLRVGDRVEYSYTREGINPLRRGKYSATYTMQWDFPVERNFLRVLYPAARKIRMEARNGLVQPNIVGVNGVTEVSCEGHHVPARSIEDDVPKDYSPLPRLELTEFQSWAEFVKWALPLCDSPRPRSAQFDGVIDRLRKAADPEQRVVLALQFVQNEIRDLSVGSWFGGHALSNPDDIVRRRSGDDKDKAALLVALLRASGIDAAPALVSDSFASSIRDRLPDPEIFDHIIVDVRIGPKTYLVDPWLSSQRGPLSQVYFARYYGYALVLRPDTRDLTAVTPPRESWPQRKIIENYRIAAPGNDSELEVITDYRGSAADETRHSFQANTREEIQKKYLEYYTRTFPEIKTEKLLWYEELPGENACRVTESYIVPKIWKLSESKDHYTITLQPDDIYSAIGSTASLPRNDPLKLNYPSTVLEETNVEMFEEWPFSAKGQSITNDFFQVRDEPTGGGSHLQFNYSYEALKDRVEVNELSKFNEAVSKAKDALGYTLTYRTPEQLAQNKSRASFNWAVAAAALCFFGTASSVAYRYFRDSKLSNSLPPPVDTPARLNGIGGWLILLVIGQVLRPISYIKTGYDLYPTMFLIDSWRSLTDPTEAAYHPWWAPTLLFELFFSIVAFVFCVLLITLFFKKRFVWPRCFAAFLILGIAGIAVDIFLVHHIPAAAGSISGSIRDVVASTAAAAIWIPYLYRSKRVKATFRY